MSTHQHKPDPPCKTCKHRKWVSMVALTARKEMTYSAWHKAGEPKACGFFVIVGCPLKKIRFGCESDYLAGNNMPQSCTDHSL